MCGIFGWAGEGAARDRARFDLALEVLAHRGPDGSGVWQGVDVLLGHRRLAIIDLSPSGHQPMGHATSGAVITYNGEIYNYVELRHELELLGHRFAGTSDTEVLLAAYVQWGADCLPRLNGMWAFAVWLPRLRRLFFARDRFGVKPFYYCREREEFAFASEPKALLELFPSHRQVDVRTLYDLLAHGQLYVGGGSFYKGIEVLPPAHCGEYSAESGTLRIWRYWDYPAAPAYGAAAADLDEFDSLLDDAIRLRMRSDVPVGLTLSGGLDSSAILAGAMNGAKGQLACFTSVYGSEDNGEASWARIAASRYGISPAEVQAPRDGWLGTLSRIAWHMDGPGYSPAVYPLWFIMREARRTEVPVLLEGQGADELLGGYVQYAVVDLLNRLSKTFTRPSAADITRLADAWLGALKTFGWRSTSLWLLREKMPRLIDFNRRRVGALSTLRAEVFGNEEKNPVPQKAPTWMEPVTARLLQDHSRDILPGLLHYGDAISMAHGIESRLPFMDYRLVEFAFSRPDASKLAPGRSKWLVRNYLERAGVAEIAKRSDKLGYPTPVEHWMAENNGALVREALLSPDARIREYCEPRAVERLIAHHVSGRGGAGNHLYRLLSTESWLRSCFQGGRERTP
jgi:asparagine synthase (glutamine-hydrolysing)